VDLKWKLGVVVVMIETKTQVLTCEPKEERGGVVEPKLKYIPCRPKEEKRGERGVVERKHKYLPVIRKRKEGVSAVWRTKT
jgi:hypothetical protein